MTWLSGCNAYSKICSRHVTASLFIALIKVSPNSLWFSLVTVLGLSWLTCSLETVIWSSSSHLFYLLFSHRPLSVLLLSSLLCYLQWSKAHYHKNHENLNTRKICSNHPKIWTRRLYHRVMHPKDDRMANSVVPTSLPQCDLSLTWACQNLSVPKFRRITVVLAGTVCTSE